MLLINGYAANASQLDALQHSKAANASTYGKAAAQHGTVLRWQLKIACRYDVANTIVALATVLYVQYCASQRLPWQQIC